ncbi:hypothetical protein EX30DRAFT_350147 [Ascodesmis nigricans]|uniref:Uncharacterized protein n=1 Tax=Ascodesmis nigricans TaxID=341454 RepID=A0A4V3SID0_9PEZI|nr:hypothetical protein EX30DRAFT_350147 [Ascodesmis nigricans]
MTPPISPSAGRSSTRVLIPHTTEPEIVELPENYESRYGFLRGEFEEVALTDKEAVQDSAEVVEVEEQPGHMISQEQRYQSLVPGYYNLSRWAPAMPAQMNINSINNNINSSFNSSKKRSYEASECVTTENGGEVDYSGGGRRRKRVIILSSSMRAGVRGVTLNTVRA